MLYDLSAIPSFFEIKESAGLDFFTKRIRPDHICIFFKAFAGRNIEFRKRATDFRHPGRAMRSRRWRGARALLSIQPITS
jgi:hypothetical protein